MIGPFPNPPPYVRGHVACLDHVSLVLRDNPWGDPAHRDVYVYLPPGYDKTDRRYPAIMVLAGFAGTGEKLLARGLTEMSLAHRIDRMIDDGCPPFIAVMPDCMSSLGGTQYVDSRGIGAYATALVEELRRFVEGRFRTTGRWGVAGKSSGGFGALHLAMTFPGVFEAVASHSGDMGFDLCYLPDPFNGLAAIQASGGPLAFVESFWRKQAPSGADFAALNLLCLSAAYSPEPDPNRGWRQPADGFPAVLPIDVETGEVDFDVLAAWRRFDPVLRVDAPDALDALRSLRVLHLDCGNRDEYHLHLGARRLVARLAAAGVPHVYEEFDGGHRSTAHRYEISLARLAGALAD